MRCPDFSWPRLARLRATVVFASLECRLWQDDDRFDNARLRRVSRARRDRRPVRDSSPASLNHSEQLSRLGRPPERYRKRPRYCSRAQRPHSNQGSNRMDSSRKRSMGSNPRDRSHRRDLSRSLHPRPTNGRSRSERRGDPNRDADFHLLVQRCDSAHCRLAAPLSYVRLNATSAPSLPCDCQWQKRNCVVA